MKANDQLKPAVGSPDWFVSELKDPIASKGMSVSQVIESAYHPVTMVMVSLTASMIFMWTIFRDRKNVDTIPAALSPSNVLSFGSLASMPATAFNAVLNVPSLITKYMAGCFAENKKCVSSIAGIFHVSR